ncbi:probable glutathione S-transferase [Citrus clementina]|uniref:probable glutathione S-transferase n=1 Tax=Citrus clementina TaxID=85681 RepID=UPI000CED7915|nr:probable glutathione S-transferase [Citrus x clementina]
MSKGEVVILDSWVSPFCLRAKIALAEKGVEYEPELRTSTVIVNYIDETWPSPPLLPSCASERAKARFWADFIDKKVIDAVCNIWKSKGKVPGTAKNEFIEILKQLEGALGEKDFFGGDSFGFVDVIAIPLTCWFYAVEKFGGFKVENQCMQRETVARILPDPEKVCEFVKYYQHCRKRLPTSKNDNQQAGKMMGSKKKAIQEEQLNFNE